MCLWGGAIRALDSYELWHKSVRDCCEATGVPQLAVSLPELGTCVCVYLLLSRLEAHDLCANSLLFARQLLLLGCGTGIQRVRTWEETLYPRIAKRGLCLGT